MDAKFTSLTDKIEFPKDCYIFKHSTLCRLSAIAEAQVLKCGFDQPVYQVLVVENRDVSNWITEKFGIEHQSPQLLRIVDGKAVEVWNHSDIRKKKLGVDLK